MNGLNARHLPRVAGHRPSCRCERCDPLDGRRQRTITIYECPVCGTTDIRLRHAADCDFPRGEQDDWVPVVFDRRGTAGHLYNVEGFKAILAERDAAITAGAEAFRERVVAWLTKPETTDLAVEAYIRDGRSGAAHVAQMAATLDALIAALPGCCDRPVPEGDTT